MRYDVLIIGGGHNGLTCACYLAAAGLKVRVLERRHVVGGAAVTEEFHPGFRNSTASYTVSLLNPKVIRDLRLKEHGLRVILRPLANFLPISEKDYLKVGGGLESTQREFAKYSRRDAERLPAYYASLERVADVLRDLILQTPPNAGGGVPELVKVLRQSRRFVKLPIEVQRDVLALFTKSAGQVLEQWFESEPAQAVFGFDSIVGNFASPYTPESAYVLLHHVFGEVNGEKGAWGHAIGGMGAITQAMAKEALAHGVELSTEAAVAEVRVKDGRAVGVTLEDGTELDADLVVANVNPKLLYLKLLDKRHLDADFLTRMQGWRCGSGTLRMNVALSELPDFTCLPGRQAQVHHSSGIIIAPSLKYMERAYFDAKQNGFAKQPIVEMLIPSTVDDSLAPKGQHVASLFCQHFDPEPANGRTWDEMREAAADTVIDAVDKFAPNFKRSVLGRLVLTPLDLERRFGLIGGDIFHGALTLDQLFSARPVLGNAAYRAPIGALYMCGAGSHPGGGVTGAPGHNAAREILHDLRWRKLLRWHGHARRG
ncbi:MAG TPA: NAD(P)/FAD-dependent oxidoreductase [Gammaproteobacteria bacterium]|nr:NAD(P)/FAD-dependent oxidoreductase [Gammaproteobacteria bacterium]